MFFLIFSLFMTTTPAHADDNLDFVNIAEGEVAPFSGKLLTDEALADILSQHQLEIDQLKIDYEAKLAKQQLDDKLSYDMLDTRYKLDVEMYTSMINNRNDLLQNQFQPSYKTHNNWRFALGFLAGSATTIGIAYSLDNLVYR